jgi:hypothetical protein
MKKGGDKMYDKKATNAWKHNIGASPESVELTKDNDG